MKKSKLSSVLLILVFISSLLYCLFHNIDSPFTILARIIISLLLFLIILIPITFHILQRHKLYNLNDALKDEHADNTTIEIFTLAFMLLASAAVICLVYATTQSHTKSLNQTEIAVFICSLLTVLLINYYSTGSQIAKEKVSNFTLSIKEFISNNFILNTMAILLIIFFMNDSNIILGIVTAYMFYALERINSNYIDRNKKQKLSNLYLPDILNQIFLNMIIIYIANDMIKIYRVIEKGIDTVINIDTTSLITHYLLFVIAIFLSYYITPKVNIYYKNKKKELINKMKE